MRGLDPRIHDEARRGKDVLKVPHLTRGLMDGRVKPGHDQVYCLRLLGDDVRMCVSLCHFT